jgi:competence protein ComEC
MEVLNPPAGAAEAEGDEGMNDLSLVVRLTYQNVSFLLTGDADQDSEEDMLSSCPNLSAQVLKVAHHGSSKATTAEWLAAVRPEIAVISVGYKNQFGHPSPATLKRLEAAGVQVYRTDENGGITITTDGHKIAVATSRRFR